MKERYYKESLLRDLAYHDDVKGNCNGMIDFTVIDSISGADVEPVRHAYWEEIQDGVFRCSDCHHCAIVDIFDRFVLTKCCHNCGAKMDKER